MARGSERIYGCLYVHFEANLGFMRNEQMGCLEAFHGDTNGAKQPHNVTSPIGLSRNVLGENMNRPEKVQKCSKNSQN